MSSSPTTPHKPYVLIVGAGPSGLLLALLLGLQNIPVTVLDLSSELDQQPRATHYGPPAVHELRRAGVLDAVLEQGFEMNTVCWRKLDGTFLAGLDRSDLDGEAYDKVAVLPLQKLGALILEKIGECPCVRVRWGCKVVEVGQDEGEAWVEVETAQGRERVQARYVVGCDGANSFVRRSLFGLEFPGFTWDVQVVATNTYYDFDRFGWHDSNFIIHPEHWYMAAKIGKDGMWRVSYGEKAGYTRDELLERQPAKFEAFLPGHPKPDEYRITNISPYKVHQRLAERMRVGRVLLAADAAHLCNPFGGLGLTGGIADVGGLADCLIGLHQGLADEDILDKYDEVRRQKYREIVDPISTSNIKRLYDQDPDKAMENDEFLKLCRRAEGDRQFSRDMQSHSMALRYDFTQDYRKVGSRRGQGWLTGPATKRHR